MRLKKPHFSKNEKKNEKMPSLQKSTENQVY